MLRWEWKEVAQEDEVSCESHHGKRFENGARSCASGGQCCETGGKERQVTKVCCASDGTWYANADCGMVLRKSWRCAQGWSPGESVKCNKRETDSKQD